MAFNFDQEHDRRGTGSIKWEYIFDGEEIYYSDHADPKYGDRRRLPMWVADMDFRCPQPVIDALHERVAHGIFGYTKAGDSYFEAVTAWMERRYGWSVDPQWITMTPGVVPAVNFAIQAFVQPGEKVLVQRPVYYPFFDAIENNDAEIVSNTLIYEEGRYRMDFDDLAEKTADPAVTMAILCSPHNPVSRVWSAAELRRFGEICMANDVLVIADEIHCDLVYSDATFTAYGTLGDAFLRNSIICTAGSKTFNMAGLKISNIFIADKERKEAFEKAISRHGLLNLNCFGPVALEAAYRHGEPWLEAAMAYIEANYHFLAGYVAEHLPQLEVIKPEGTYLLWVDCRELGLAPEERKEFFMDEARVYLDEGELFGPEGEGFERFNLACPRSILVEALERIRRAVAERS